MASPRAVLTGHDSHITMIFVSAEHGLVLSTSKGTDFNYFGSIITGNDTLGKNKTLLCSHSDGTILMHTTLGDLLRRLELDNNTSIGIGINSINLLLMSRDCIILVLYGNDNLITHTTSGKQLNYMKSALIYF